MINKDKKVNNGRRRNVSVSLTDAERDRLTEYAESLGLSLSAFLRMAANKFIDEDKNKEVQ
jgi:hypothetical protein